MLELTRESVANAAARARALHSRSPLRVSRLSDSEVAVPCASGEHAGGHVCRFERRPDGSLWGECVLRETGELCPAHLGRHVCYHLASGVVLFFALEDRDALVEHAVKFDGPLPRETWGGRFDDCRRVRAPGPEGDSEAVLVAPPVVRRGRREFVRGFQI